MKCCTFFGHAENTGITKERIAECIEKAIENDGVDAFYVGDNGNFDRAVIAVLTELEKKYTNTKWYIVIAYLNRAESREYHNTVYPEGLEITPARFCIDKRNRWMIDRSDVVISHVIRPQGRSAKYVRIAERKGKKIYNIT